MVWVKSLLALASEGMWKILSKRCGQEMWEIRLIKTCEFDFVLDDLESLLWSDMVPTRYIWNIDSMKIPIPPYPMAYSCSGTVTSVSDKPESLLIWESKCRWWRYSPLYSPFLEGFSNRVPDDWWGFGLLLFLWSYPEQSH